MDLIVAIRLLIGIHVIQSHSYIPRESLRYAALEMVII